MEMTSSSSIVITAEFKSDRCGMEISDHAPPVALVLNSNRTVAEWKL